ncbi:hypothetical protein GEW_04332, partial [Pasteurella multocida subsp. gallicida str. Anand1_poultry]
SGFDDLQLWFQDNDIAPLLFLNDNKLISSKSFKPEISWLNALVVKPENKLSISFSCFYLSDFVNHNIQ